MLIKITFLNKISISRNAHVSKFCGQVVKFVWRVWRHLVNLRFATHSHLSPSKRSHSPDTISWKNRLQTHHISPQNVETKSSPKFLTTKNFLSISWVTISFRRFGNQYDEFGDDSFTKSYQGSVIFLMVKDENVWRTLGRLNDTKLVTQIWQLDHKILVPKKLQKFDFVKK